VSIETVTVMFTDLVDSTALLSRLGEERGEELRRGHFGLRCPGQLSAQTSGSYRAWPPPQSRARPSARSASGPHHQADDQRDP
jgi:hypothetical protein